MRSSAINRMTSAGPKGCMLPNFRIIETGYAPTMHCRLTWKFKLQRLPRSRWCLPSPARMIAAQPHHPAAHATRTGLFRFLAVNRRDLGTPPYSIKSDTCHADSAPGPRAETQPGFGMSALTPIATRKRTCGMVTSCQGRTSNSSRYQYT